MNWTRFWVDPSVELSQETLREFCLPQALPRQVSAIDGSPFLWAQAAGGQRCVCKIDSEGNPQWDFDIAAWLEDCRNQAGRNPKCPWYSRIPGFDVNAIPVKIRKFIFDKTFGGNSARARRTPDLSLSSGIQHLVRTFSHNGTPLGSLARFRAPRWPKEKKAALVFTMDVDSAHTQKQQRNVIREILEKEGFRGAWYIVTGCYALDYGFLDDLSASGHEIGWHGHYHDHRMAFLDSEKRFLRFQRAKLFLQRYHVIGMRMDNFLWSEALYRDATSYFKYDTSFRDAFPISEVGGGCATSVPFQMSSGLWQIPISTTPDPFLPSTWSQSQCLDLFRAQINMQIALGGLIHILLHPEPLFSLTQRNLNLLRAIVGEIKSRESDIWPALPRDVYHHLLHEEAGYLPCSKSNTNISPSS